MLPFYLKGETMGDINLLNTESAINVKNKIKKLYKQAFDDKNYDLERQIVTVFNIEDDREYLEQASKLLVLYSN